MRRFLVLFLALAALTMTALSGCGSSGDSSSGGGTASGGGTSSGSEGAGSGGGTSSDADDQAETPGITKAQLLKEGDKICERMDSTKFDEEVAYQKKHIKMLLKQNEAKRIELTLDNVGLAAITKEGEELEALGMPPGDEQQLETIYKTLKAAVREGEKSPGSLEAPDSLFAEVNRLAAAYGFEKCNLIT